MCGIAGIWSPQRDAAIDRSVLERMVAALHHRGPDGRGYHVADGVGLGHARLSVIDLATGAQPIYNEDRSVCVVCNGEIFNYVELRRELLAGGHALRTQSDTEVIVHLYEDLGDAFVERLNGQFAIALWDGNRRRLVLARDRTGIRPLLFARHGERLLFASEAKALFAEGSLSARLDPQALGQTFTYWAPLEGRSAFAGIESLRPGSLLIADSRGMTTRRYWDWDFSVVAAAANRRPEAYAEELRAILSDATRLQMRADVPVATYLSGGLDSSAVTALACGFSAIPLHAFSIGFDDSQYDESAYQQDVAAYLGVERTMLRVSCADIASAFRRAIWHIESPILRTAPIPLMLLAGAVREAGYKVVLTGEGADEVFAGYDVFREAKIRRWMARQPTSAWRARLLERLYPYLRASPVRGRSLSHVFFARNAGQSRRFGYSHVPRWTTTRRGWRFFSPELLAQQPAVEPLDEIGGLLPAGADRWPALGCDQYVEVHTLLSSYLLSAQGDRVAMAHGIEGRFPFLDHRLIEFAGRLPPQVKLFGIHEKYVLRKSVADLLPRRIVQRTKQPYRAPDAQSFVDGGRLRDEVADLLSPMRIRDAGYFRPEAVARLVAKCVAGRAIGFGDNMAFVGVLSTMALHEAYVGAGAAAWRPHANGQYEAGHAAP
jgi:asparagine synthase (glutamine-hydrolysing)